MSDDHKPSLREWFDAVVELPPAEREAALRSRGVEHDAIAEVLALCAASDRTFTTRANAARDAMLEAVVAPALAVGEVLGHWRIVGEIGRGGMGRVYRVERSDGHFAQVAALKFIAGPPRPERLAHFARERQLLARLNHPGVARLLDGGASADGRPYLVMEFVDGVHIDRWCGEHRLGEPAIVRLFLQACEAVAFAHRQLIVHCDLKPSNLLVERGGRVVLLDFGVARLIGGLDDGVDVSSGHTPGYASPEQCAGEAVSTASDVYSLGLVLSGLLRESPAAASAELRAIVDRASARDPLARYGSAESLAADLRRFLSREPVEAVDGGGWYRLRCFLRRHAVPVSLAAGLLVALIAGLVINVHSLARAERERLRAERTVDFLGNVLSAVDPVRARDLDKTLMREILDEAARSAQKALADEPAVLGTVEGVIGRTYQGIGEYQSALAHLQTAVDLLPAGDVRPRLAARLRIVDAMGGLERSLEALPMIEALAQETEGAFGPRDPDTLRARQKLAMMYGRTNRWRDAERLGAELQPLLERHLEPDDPAIWDNLRWLAITRGELGQFEPAERTFLDLIQRAQTRYGADDGRTMRFQHSLYILYLRNGRYAQAETLIQDLYPRSVRVFGERSSATIQHGSALGSALRLGGKVAESESWYRQALEQSRAAFGADDNQTLRYEANYANLEVDLGRPADALARIERILPVLVRNNGETSLQLVETWRTRGRANTALGRIDDARAAWRKALAIGIAIYGREDHPMVQEDRKALEALDKA